jgi:hypothetical protein
LQDPHFRNFTRLLLKLPERAWGVDSSRFPGASPAWKNHDFHKARKEDESFQIAEQSWELQSSYIDWSMSVLFADSLLLAM